MDPGGRHIVAVAAPGDFARRSAPDAPRASYIGHDLAGMRASVRPLITGTVACSPAPRASPARVVRIMIRIDIARQHARRVGDGLAAPELRVVAVEHESVSPPSCASRPRRRRGCGSRASRRSSPASCRRAAAIAVGRHLLPARPDRMIRRSSLPAAGRDRGNGQACSSGQDGRCHPGHLVHDRHALHRPAASPMMSGGKSRTTLSPAATVEARPREASRHLGIRADARRPRAGLRRVPPRSSRMAATTRRGAAQQPGHLLTRSKKPCSSITSSTALATAMASGLPPK